jgi:hypothetical protein
VDAPFSTTTAECPPAIPSPDTEPRRKWGFLLLHSLRESETRFPLGVCLYGRSAPDRLPLWPTFNSPLTHLPVSGVTDALRAVWHNYSMKSAGTKSNILRVSVELKALLESAGRRQEVPPGQVLFREDGKSAGVFLVGEGEVLMGVRNMPKLDRVFSASSLLGLPATFTGHPYSLTALTLTQSDVVHIPRKEFLQLMRDQPDLCREATDMLGRELSFIQSALAGVAAR